MSENNHTRLIDEDKRARKKPMRVLVLGMCRTGTTSVSTALRKLGYTPYLMRDVLVKPRDLKLWQEAINITLLPPQDRPAKQRNLPPYGRPEFDKLLGDVDCIMDIPGCIFAKELIEAYPDAKVILTASEYNTWERTMQDSIWCLCTWRLFAFCRYFNLSHLAPLLRLMHSVFEVHNGNHYGGPESEAAFKNHNDTVRTLVPKQQLLELDMESQLTWEPLCNFLGKTEPKEAYPNVKEDKGIKTNLENSWYDLVQYFILMLLLPGIVTAAAVLLYLFVDDLRGLRDDYILMPLKEFLDS